jgi:hypothetical protein
MGGEGDSLEIRKRLWGCLSNKNASLETVKKRVRSVFGATEFDVLGGGVETNFNIWLREQIAENEPLRKALGLKSPSHGIPLFFTTNPFRFDVTTVANKNEDGREEKDSEENLIQTLVYTSLSPARKRPLIGYDIQDEGRVYEIEDILNALKAADIKIPEALNPFDVPGQIVAVYGRKGDGDAIKLEAACMSHTLVGDAIVKDKTLAPAIGSYVVHKEGDCVRVQLMLQEGVVLDDQEKTSMMAHAQFVIVQELWQQSLEYRKIVHKTSKRTLLQDLPARAVPLVEIIPYSPKPGIKLKRVA